MPKLTFLKLRLEHRDWEKAFFEVIPKRKFDKVKDPSVESSPVLSDDAMPQDGTLEVPGQNGTAESVCP